MTRKQDPSHTQDFSPRHITSLQDFPKNQNGWCPPNFYRKNVPKGRLNNCKVYIFYNFTSSIIKKYNLMESFGETQGDSCNILESCWYLWDIRLYTSALRWYSKSICSKEGQPKNPNLFEAEPKASGAQIPQIIFLFGFHFDDRVIKIYHKC